MVLDYGFDARAAKKIQGEDQRIFNNTAEELCSDVIKLIKQEAKMGECIYQVPMAVWGRPWYDFDDMVNAVVKHLMKQKFRVNNQCGKLEIKW